MPRHLKQGLSVFILVFVLTLQLIGILGMLFGILSVQGCSSRNDINIDTPLFDRRPAVKSIIVTKPPLQVVYIGTVTDESICMTKMILQEARHYKYSNYKFNPTVSLDIKHAAEYTDTQSDTNEIKGKK